MFQLFLESKFGSLSSRLHEHKSTVLLSHISELRCGAGKKSHLHTTYVMAQESSSVEPMKISDAPRMLQFQSKTFSGENVVEWHRG